MMSHEITAQAGARRRRKRVGRGESSGHGKTSGRGNKGFQSRAGSGPHPLHEGGQMPIFRRTPKRGFSNYHFETRYHPINLETLEARFDAGQTVDPQALRDAGLISGSAELVKVLGKGSLAKKLTVVAHAFSATARQAIESAGGAATVIERIDRAAAAKAKRRSTRGKKRPPKPTRLAKRKERRGATAD
jgi:large subunit ribosomal protein L15